MCQMQLFLLFLLCLDNYLFLVDLLVPQIGQNTSRILAWHGNDQRSFSMRILFDLRWTLDKLTSQTWLLLVLINFGNLNYIVFHYFTAYDRLSHKIASFHLFLFMLHL